MGTPAIPESVPDLPGTMGRYMPFARIGSGGMADVYLAVARGPSGFNKLAVLKRVKNYDDPAIAQMFLDEARLAARLNHPNIVYTYEVGEASEKYFIAMEYLEGQSLHAVLASKPDPGDFLAAHVIAQVLRGLHFAHELKDFDGSPLGVVHRDVSPHNVHVTYDGQVKVLDFGIAKTSLSSTHTETGILKGKIRYMAPEQFGEPNIDRRADLFACGIVLWEMLARRPLFQGEPSRVMNRVLNEDAPLLRSVRPEVAPELEAIVAKALQRNRDERYATADAMRADLEGYVRATAAADTEPEKDVASMMNEVFAKDRDEVRARIRTFVDNLPPDDDARRGPIAAASAPSERELPLLGLHAEIGASSGGGIHRTSPSAAGIAASMKPASAAAPRRGVPVWAMAAMGLFVLGGGFALLRSTKNAGAAPQPIVAQPSPAHLTLATTPPGATVTFEGARIGVTPLEHDLPPGPQTFVVTADGYEPETVRIDAHPGATIERDMALRPVAPPPTAAAPAANGSASVPPVEPPVAKTTAARSTPARSPAAPKTSASATPHVKIRVLDDTDSP